MRTCEVAGCERAHYARGWCNAHYQRVVDNGSARVADPIREDREGCSIAGCDQAHHANGWCSAHSRRAVRYGDPLAGGPMRQRFSSPEERFWSKVDQAGGPDSCWPWTASCNKYGYGQVSWRIDGARRVVVASRVAFFLTNGFWPVEALHACDNPPCCNPDHLSGGTHAENMEQARRRGRQRRSDKGRYVSLAR